MLAGRACAMMGSQHAAAGVAAGRCLLGRPQMLLQRPGQSSSPQLQQPGVARAYNDGSASDGADAQGTGQGGGVYAQWQVYKSRGAMTVKPIKPRWIATPNGGWRLEKEGGLMLEVAAGADRKYDWANKVNIQLNPLELAAIVSQPDQSHAFYHDTFKGQPGREGLKTKTLKWDPSDKGDAYYINTTMTDKLEGPERKTQASVSISVPEFFVLKALVEKCMPHMYGFDAVFNNGGGM